MKIKVAIMCFLVLFLASCSTITPSPNFKIIWVNALANAVNSSTTYISVSEITVENNSSVETVIYQSTYQYLKDGNIIYEGDTFLSMHGVLPANTTNNGTVIKGTLELENFAYPFPSEVWDQMVANDWEGVTLRIFMTGRDNYGYNKTYTTSFDFGIARI